MGRLIDANSVYNAIQITTDNFGVAKHVVETNMLDMLAKIPTVEAIPKDQYEARKNDLGVDAVSRKAVLNTLDSMDSALDEDRTVETYKELLKECYKVLPSVTPIRPKGHWIEQIDHEENCRTLICSNCDRPALHDGDSIWKHKFCPHCGADMREVKE